MLGNADLAQVILVDNSEFSLQAQPENGILIESFEGTMEQKEDKELCKVLE